MIFFPQVPVTSVKADRAERFQGPDGSRMARAWPRIGESVREPVLRILPGRESGWHAIFIPALRPAAAALGERALPWHVPAPPKVGVRRVWNAAKHARRLGLARQASA